MHGRASLCHGYEISLLWKEIFSLSLETLEFGNIHADTGVSAPTDFNEAQTAAWTPLAWDLGPNLAGSVLTDAMSRQLCLDGTMPRVMGRQSRVVPLHRVVTPCVRSMLGWVGLVSLPDAHRPHPTLVRCQGRNGGEPSSRSSAQKNTGPECPSDLSRVLRQVSEDDSAIARADATCM